MTLKCTQVEKPQPKCQFQKPNDLNTFAGRAFAKLEKHVLEIDTYPFEYLSLKEDLPFEFAGINADELEVIIKGAGIASADDFTWISPLNLSLSTGIEPEKISALYAWAETMIRAEHAKQKEVVAFIDEIRHQEDDSDSDSSEF
jgi:hypothetical protein